MQGWHDYTTFLARLDHARMRTSKRSVLRAWHRHTTATATLTYALSKLAARQKAQRLRCCLEAWSAVAATLAALKVAMGALQQADR